MNILEEVLVGIKSINKKQRKFLMSLTQGLVGIQGKKTFRNSSRYIKISEHTLARQMSKTMDFVGINTALIEKRMQQKKEVWAAAHDNSFIEKSGKKTSGLGFFWSGSTGRVEKGLEIDLIGVIKVGGLGAHREGYALSTQQTPASPAKSKKEKKKEGNETKVDWQVAHVKKVAPQLAHLGITHMLADAIFANKKYVDGISSVGLHLVSKLRKDARLRRLYTGPQKTRGRRRKFDEGNAKDEDFAQSLPEIIQVDKSKKIELRSCILFSVALQREIKIVKVTTFLRNEKCDEVFFFSTDLALDARTIYKLYTSRFQIEFVIRDAKSFSGLQDCQSRDQQRLHYHFNASFVALNVVKVKNAELQKNKAAPDPFSMASWSRKYNLEIVADRFFSMFDLNSTLIKSHPNYERFLSFGGIIY